MSARDTLQAHVSKDLLSALQELARNKTPVTLYLASGDSKAGVLLDVGKDLVHLGEIVGKEFFDALIAIQGILGVEVRVRS